MIIIVKKTTKKTMIKKKSEIKAVFLDFWGTIVENGVFPSPVRQVHRMLRVQMPFSEYIERFEKAFMITKYDNLTEAFKAVTKEFSVNPPSFVYDNLIGMWNKNTFLSKPFPDTVSTLQDLKKDYKLVLISNTDNLSVPQLLDKFDLRKYFDEIVLSCDVGMLKTDKKMFETALKKLKLKKTQVVMIGDSIPTDIEGAKKAGIRGILVDHRDRREYEDKIISLSEIRSKIEG
ncbi:MAG: HAD family hydrolase [Nanoarchaeota archaeon]|nr:HAD family hydrolase [Nanoarchaeota archaeon]MBU1269806.1 HAD family hydrolase [Nanoarchaeota archaeon]MBU1604277.1 HAD family hydrolase [Nanoarchaeota archaeon]MBU2442449.1 HAD family hydrolase [Nanoarchaeota archaeon]